MTLIQGGSQKPMPYGIMYKTFAFIDQFWVIILEVHVSMKPVIAVTCDYDHTSRNSKIHEDYYRAVSIFGGLPILLPGNNIEDVSSILGLIDGILLIGGDDVDPSFYGEIPHIKLGDINPYRDEFEMELTRCAVDMGMPVLGICRGAQIMNVAMGGSLYQDIESQLENTPIKHRQKAPHWYGTHHVILDRESNLYDIVGQEDVKVNSFHHQSVKDIAPGFSAIGHAADGVIEAIELVDHPFVIGLQWHPERMIDRYDHAQLIFEKFIKSAKVYRN